MSAHNGIVRLVRPATDLKAVLDPSQCTFVFCHIGKSGGTTFRSIMAGTAVYQKQRFEQVSGNIEDAMREVSDWGALKDNVRYVMGHIPLGAARINQHPHVHLAILRDPIDRVISHVKMHELRSGEALTKLPPPGTEPLLPDNLQTRMLAGKVDFSEPCTRHDLDKAMENLEENLSLIGFTEEFDAFVSQFLALTEGDSVMYSRWQVSTNTIPEDRLSVLRDQAVDRDSLDIELVDHARQRHSDWNAKILRAIPETVPPDTTMCAIPFISVSGSGVDFSPTRKEPNFIQIQSADEGPFARELEKIGYDVSQCLAAIES
ncbi:MAG: sulfotransferase family 2 domain-containing protein [Rhodospirillaceae bacterium]|nr:sulfotransferase family 2 domain-containing protein [Rhodospirillaceae bacterium]MBT6088241.1 sulfotransferase family 2 domain-containing protein [Rhodospirillaceae bacterium]